MLAAAMGSDDATASMHRTHAEIFRLARLLDRLIRDLPPEGPDVEDRTDLQRVLYGLEAILRLHQAQEEDLYLSIGDPGSTPDEPAAAVDPARSSAPRRPARPGPQPSRRRSRARIADSSAGSA